MKIGDTVRVAIRVWSIDETLPQGAIGKIVARYAGMENAWWVESGGLRASFYSHQLEVINPEPPINNKELWT